MNNLCLHLEGERHTSENQGGQKFPSLVGTVGVRGWKLSKGPSELGYEIK